MNVMLQAETVHADDLVLNEVMLSAARKLNIKPHVVGTGNQAKLLAACGDIEVHAVSMHCMHNGCCYCLYYRGTWYLVLGAWCRAGS